MLRPNKELKRSLGKSQPSNDISTMNSSHYHMLASLYFRISLLYSVFCFMLFYAFYYSPNSISIVKRLSTRLAGSTIQIYLN